MLHHLQIDTIFICRIHKDDGGVDAIRAYITDKGVQARALALVSHTESKYNSFKLTVSLRDESNIIDPQFWPSGVCIKK